jgi:K+-sensing histidine kinase KdpD
MEYTRFGGSMALPFVIDKTDSNAASNNVKPSVLQNQPGRSGLEEAGLSSIMAGQADSLSFPAMGSVAEFFAHDLRHHLSTIHANAEFLVNRNINLVDREELLDEISTAIRCMTDQLDSLLLFTRTGCALQPRWQSLKAIIDRAMQMVSAHPEARRVEIFSHDKPLAEVCIDGPKLCSAIFNLLLNACQSTKPSPERRALKLH